MKRIIVSYLFIFVFLIVGVVRIGFIINEKSDFASINNSSKTLDLGSVRGTIFDKNGGRLTNAEYEYFAAVSPNSKAIKSVSKYLTESQRKTLISGYPVAVKVDKNFVSSFVRVLKIPKRYSGVASHLIGYCNENGNGICGIEMAYNKILKGKKIKINYSTDVNGQVIDNLGKFDGDLDYKGNGVMLTIDKSIQKLCEDVAKNYMTAGAIVVLENKSGKIRAMVSVPSYDPNNVSAALDNENSPFFNRSIAAYNSGSVFKLLVSACALYYNIDLNFNCKGFIDVGDTRFNCLANHGKTDMKQALCVSCNCYFVKLGEKIGAKRLLDFAKSFGFGNEIKLCNSIVSTGALLPKLSQLEEKPAELANFSFGQGVIMTSPLQIASMIQCIANGGKKIMPTLVEGICDYKGNLITNEKRTLPTYLLEKEDAKTLQKYMINTVKKGTGRAAKPNFAGAGGKTATAQTGIFDKNGKAVYQTWFGGFYPAKNPEYTIVVLCENGSSGSKTSAPIFKMIADGINNIG